MKVLEEELEKVEFSQIQDLELAKEEIKISIKKLLEAQETIIKLEENLHIERESKNIIY